ncbi:hypothetical protein SLS57_004218 [Botryosphaeria dothidea]
MAAPTTNEPTLYFGYGSNLWLAQMARRCPTSTYLGIARLRRWRWLINERGYANVVELPSSSSSENLQHTVYGMVYSLQPEDERRLDVNEGVPDAYGKEWLEVDFWRKEEGGEGVEVDVGKGVPEKKRVLVYVDRERVGEGPPKEEYVHRMNKAVGDAVKVGVPKKWVEEVVRKFIPEEK